MKRIDLHVWGPLIALIGLFILGALLNPAFLAPANLSNTPPPAPRRDRRAHTSRPHLARLV